MTFDPSQLTLAALPSVRLEERYLLPTCQGIYFAIMPDGAILYIGKAKNINRRWVRHHREMEIAKHSGVSISWLQFDGDAPLLDALEKACIEHFAPSLNGARGIIEDEDLVECSVPIPAWAYAIFAARARAQFRTARNQIAFELERWAEQLAEEAA